MYDFEYCMKQECKVCSKKLECEREEKNKAKKKVSKCLWKNGKTLKGTKEST